MRHYNRKAVLQKTRNSRPYYSVVVDLDKIAVFVIWELWHGFFQAVVAGLAQSLSSKVCWSLHPRPPLAFDCTHIHAWHIQKLFSWDKMPNRDHQFTHRNCNMCLGAEIIAEDRMILSLALSLLIWPKAYSDPNKWHKVMQIICWKFYSTLVCLNLKILSVLKFRIGHWRND